MIDAAEQERRERVMRNARAGTEIEGGTSSPQVRALQDQWVRGEITGEELDRLALAQIERQVAARQRV